jgi:SAM-dependent methyltransferase
MAIERIVPGPIEWDAFYANHIARYNFAKVQLESSETKKINLLDAACGVGYGSNFLAGNLNCTVTAVDRSAEALTVANNNFRTTSIRFLEDDCHTLEAAAAYGTYDAIVSFETLEHLPYPEKFIAACYQNLTTGGKLIISTPNQNVSSPGGSLDWEYHEKEYQPQELIEILSKAGFLNIKLYGQQMTAIGKLRSQFRAELNKINSNPFMRLGRLVQKIVKGHQYNAVLPEQAEDFEIAFYNSPDEVNALAENGPFVLIAVCNK